MVQTAGDVATGVLVVWAVWEGAKIIVSVGAAPITGGLSLGGLALP